MHDECLSMCEHCRQLFYTYTLHTHTQIVVKRWYWNLAVFLDVLSYLPYLAESSFHLNKVNRWTSCTQCTCLSINTFSTNKIKIQAHVTF